MRKTEFLEFTSAQLAAAAFILAFNLSRSPSAPKLGLVSLSVEGLQKHPLSVWADSIAALTQVTQIKIRPVYRTLLKYVNELYFGHKL